MNAAKTMKFSSDELMPFFEVRTGMSKLLVYVQTGEEIVITRHGKPIGALIAASELYRYRELERIMTEFDYPAEYHSNFCEVGQRAKSSFGIDERSG